MSNDDKLYKSSVIRQEISEDLERNVSKFNDPVVLGELVYKLLEERENTNRILKNLLAKLETLEAKLGGTSTIQKQEEMLLPEIDEQILSFVKEQGKATAETVRAHFNYKGTNAASSRLNRLYDIGMLEKKQVGKKVFFFPK